MTRRSAPRLPFAPLEALAAPLLRSNGVEPSTRALAALLGVNPRQVYRWRDYGVTHDQADELAVACGYHPLEVWQGSTTRACAARGCGAAFEPTTPRQVYCSQRCRHREANRAYARRRYQSDPAFADAERERAKAYYAACADYCRLRARRNHLAKQRPTTNEEAA